MVSKTTEGISDLYNINTELLSKATSTRSLRKKIGKVKGKNMIYDFVFLSNDGFFHSNKTLVREIKLRFDRAIADLGFVKVGNIATDDADKMFKIQNCFALTEFISSENR